MSEEIKLSNMKEKLLSEFSKYENSLNGEKDSYSFKIKKQAIEEFEKQGFPTQKHELWKYTNVGFINRNDFSIPNDYSISSEIIDNYRFKNFENNLLVFVNGIFDSELSNYSSIDGVHINDLNSLITSNDKIIESHYSKLYDFNANPFVALNTALTDNGVCIILDDNVVVEKPYHLLFINNSQNDAILINLRKLIILGKNSKAHFIETVHTLGENNSLSNSVGEIYVGKNSYLDYNIIQNDSENSYFIGSNYVKQERDSKLYTHTISLDGKFIRNNLTSVLNDENIEANFFGLFFMDKQNFVDNHTLADHAKPHCQSNENYRGILDDKSTAVFNGKILVRRDAQKTNAYQSNKNLLLSDNATINTKPELEIYADDVKCSHGATSGNLDKESIFYLQARGIDYDTAQALLLSAFANEIIEKIEIPELRDEIEQLILKKLEIHH